MRYPRNDHMAKRLKQRLCCEATRGGRKLEQHDQPVIKPGDKVLHTEV
jgi:hypothetical protein